MFNITTAPSQDDGPIKHRSQWSSSPSSDSTPRLPHRSSETTKTVDTTGRMSGDTAHSFPHRHFDQENSHERESAPAAKLHSRWNSSSRIIVDRSPSQLLSCRRMGRGPSSAVSVKESHHEDRSTVGRLQDSDSRWSSGDRAAFDTSPSQPLARRRMVLGPSRVSAFKESLEHTVEMKNLTLPALSISQQASSSHSHTSMPSSYSKSKLDVSVFPRFRTFGEELPVLPPRRRHATSA
jgi:hypothetical protein